MKIGYVRVSTMHQHTDRQDDLMKRLGVEKIFLDKESGAKQDRPGLKEMEAYVREGDTLVVESISRLARSTRDLLSIVELLQSKGVELIIQKENIDTSTPQGKFMLTVFAALSELEREQILQRSKEGIESAKRKGVKFGRPEIEIDMEEFKKCYAEWKNKELPVKEFMKKTGIGNRSTFYKKIHDYENGILN